MGREKLDFKSLLKVAKWETGSAKVAIQGFAGSGKSFTSVEIAIGLWKLMKSTRPIVYLDTETGSDWLLAKFEKAGIQVLRSRSRSSADMIAVLQGFHEESDILLIDSLTRYWTDFVEGYRNQINNERRSSNRPPIQKLEFQHWQPIKKTWREEFTDKFIDSPGNIIFTGRSGFEYESHYDEDGKMQDLEKTGTKMKVETETNFEPSLLLEMARVDLNPEFMAKKKGRRQTITDGRQVINRCFVLKERSDSIDGKVFDNPTFENFLPHFSKISFGKGNIQRDASASSASGYFVGEGQPHGDYEFKQRERWMEEIEGLLVSCWPGRTAEEIRQKTDTLYKYFQTRSWIAIKQINSRELEGGFSLMLRDLKEIQKTPSARSGKNGSAQSSKKIEISNERMDLVLAIKDQLNDSGCKGQVDREQLVQTLSKCEIEGHDVWVSIAELETYPHEKVLTQLLENLVEYNRTRPRAKEEEGIQLF